MTFIIAIDGPAAAGKGTLARALAERLGFAYLDTGALYRAVGLKAAAADMVEEAGEVARTLEQADLNHPDLRTLKAGDYASRVAVQPEVRAALFDFQRGFGADGPGAVLDGRDIGTVIFPDAPLKLFITASAEVRAQRRLADVTDVPAGKATFEDVLAQVRERDARDASRTDAPLRPAEDAHTLNTSHMSAEHVLSAALDLALPLIQEST